LSAAQPSLKWVPWASVPHLPGQIILPSGHRYYDPLRLPKARFGFVRSSLSSPDTLHCSLYLCFPPSKLSAGLVGKHEHLLPIARSFPYLWDGSPYAVLSTRRQLALPKLVLSLPKDFRVTPLNTCPGLRPRWCPGHLPQRIQDCCLPRHAERRLSPASQDYPNGPQLYIFRGSIQSLYP